MKLGLGLFIISVLISIIFLSPSVRTKTMKLFLDSDKQVLSQLEMQYQDVNYRIVKVQQHGNLAVELYKFVDNQLLFLDSQNLTDKKDAFYKFDSTKYNLFLKDLDGDGNIEIILPSLDKNMKARLNVFNFDPIQEKLVKLSKH